MPLPTFRYHPDPLRSGSIITSTSPCICCDQSRGYVYAASIYSEHDLLEEAICPWCIADATAHKMFRAYFVDDEGMDHAVPTPAHDEIVFRTPGFATWQSERWLACCDDAMAFLEPIGTTELRRYYPELEGTLMMYIVHELELSGDAANHLLNSLNRDTGPTAYVFRCLHCEALKGYIDFL